MIKKLGLVFGILILLLLAAIVVIPLVVNVDQYRPKIEQLVNEKINGKLSLGELKLSLWGQIRVEVAGVTLTDAQNRKLLTVADSYFHLPFASILAGAPAIVFRMSDPELNVYKDKDGKLNVMSLMKSGTEAANNNAPPAQQSQGSSSIAIPGLAARATIGIELIHALLHYRDEATGLDSQTKDLNLVARNLSLSRPMQLEIWAKLDTKMGKTMNVRGPVRLDATVAPKLAGKEFESATVVAKLWGSDLEISLPGLFVKKPGVPAVVELTATTSKQEARIEKLLFRFLNAELTSDGSISQLASGAVVKLDMKSNAIDLKPWNDLIPVLKQYELGGTASLSANASGPASQLQYQADLKIDGLTAKAPMLKLQPRFDALVHVITDQIENMTLTMKAPANDLLVRGRVLSFTRPQATFEVTSSSLDLDQLVDFPKKTAAAKATPEPQATEKGENTAGGKQQPPKSDYDAMLAPLRESPALEAVTASVTANLKFIKAYDVKMTDVAAKMTMRNLAVALESFSMNIWGGAISANAVAQLKPAQPTYQFGAKVAHLDLKQAVASQYNPLKNSILGTANFSMDGSGTSFNPDAAIPNLKAKGNMKVTQAVFGTIDVGKMASEALNSAIQRIAQKYPQVKDKHVGVPPGRESRYDLVSSDFTIADGKFSAPNFVAKAEPKQGIDMNGNTVVGMKDYSLDARWMIVDSYNLTKASDLDVNVAGVDVGHILGSPVSFPVNVGCSLSAPCYKYTEVPEYLAGVAFKNITQAAQGKAKAQLQKKAEDLIQQAPPGIQNPLQNLKKKFFGH